MAKIAVTPSIVFAEFVLYRKKVSLPKVHALTLFVLVFQIIVNVNFSSSTNNMKYVHILCYEFLN